MVLTMGMRIMSKSIKELHYTYDQKFTRVLVISDSHNHITHAIKVIQSGRYDLVLHLGDIVSDVDDLRCIFPELNIEGVRGNCDFYDTNYPDILIVTINGVKILACHGHQFRVKSGTMLLDEYAKKITAKIALYGHSHQHKLSYEEDITLLNPGSIALPRGGPNPTYGVIEIEKNCVLHSSLPEIKKKNEKS
jgi:putative phosphoesterase